MSRRGDWRVDGRERAGEAGVTFVELLIALGVSLVVVAVAVQAAADIRAVFGAQPEASDLLQRARTGLAAVTEDLAFAGGGPWRTSDPGPLVRWMAPVQPRRLGPLDADPEQDAFADRLTIITARPDGPQADIGDAASADTPAPLIAGPWCPPVDDTCGFSPDGQAMVFDRSGAFDPFVVSAAEALTVTPAGGAFLKPWSRREQPQIVGIRRTTYYVDGRRRQLRRDDGDRSDLPIADEVTAFAVRYFGDPFPPFEPRPPPGDENCVIDRTGALRLPVLPADHGALVELTPDQLRDGPWCGVAPWRFDADLLRLRSVRVSLRVQAESPASRGADPDRFAHPGIAREARVEVPDLTLVVEVSPRNLQRR